MMDKKLLQLYDDELQSIREKGQKFADAYPKIASRLKLGQGDTGDPMVGCLVESFAFLTSQLRYDLDVESEQLTQNSLQLLYPHYYLPIPSYSMVQFESSEQQASLHNIEKGTRVCSDANNRAKVIFTTAYNTTVSPLGIDNIIYKKLDDVSVNQRKNVSLRSYLQFDINCSNSNISLADVMPPQLRFYINGLQDSSGLWLENICRDVRVIEINTDAGESIDIDVSAITPCGFSDDESLLPFPGNSFTGFQLLSEYFAYPERFNFFSLGGISQCLKSQTCSTATITLYFDSHHPSLEKSMHQDLLKLNCTPIINVFEHTAEPIDFDHTQSEYHLVADAQLPAEAHEIYSVESVGVSSSRYKDHIQTAAYFGRRFSQTSKNYIYWHTIRKSCASLGEHHIVGDEVFIAFSEQFDEMIEESLILSPKLLLTNRDLAENLPYGGGQPNLTFERGHHDVIEYIHCIKPISPIRYRDSSHDGRSGLSTHLAINQLGLFEPGKCLEHIKQCLALYSFSDPYSNNIIEKGIVDITTKLVTKRHPSTLTQGFCRGLCVKIAINEVYITVEQRFLFGEVMQRFLSQTCSINMFVRVQLVNQNNDTLLSWPPVLGNEVC